MLEEESQSSIYSRRADVQRVGNLLKKSSDIWLYVKKLCFSNTRLGFTSQASEGIYCSEFCVLSSPQYLQWYRCVIT